jgi:iron complex transport system permease protein
MMQVIPIASGAHCVRGGRWSLLLAHRPLKAAGALALALLPMMLLALCAGAGWLTPAQVLTALFDGGPEQLQLLVKELRLPRVIAGMLAGAALGAGGCLVQALSRNRLATPDMLGVSDGATLGIFIGLIVGATGLMGPWWSGPAGALAALVLLILASGRMGSRGHAVLVVGIGVASLLRAATELALSRQELMHASALYAWSVGSLAGRGYAAALPLAIGLAVLLPLSLLLARSLKLLHLGEDTAASLGVPVRATQWSALLLAVLLAGLAVGVCGPIAFVALAAPFIASRLQAGPGIALLSAALGGALLVSAADTLGRIVLEGAELPAGVICNLLGGPFLLWILLTERTGETD